MFSIYLRELRWYRDRHSVLIQVDSDNPTIKLLTTHPYHKAGHIQLAVSAIDPTSSVVLMDVGIKAPSASDFAWTNASVCSEAAGSGNAWCPAFNASAEGKYELKFRAVDSVGNETISTVYELFVDDSPPIATTSYNNDWITAEQDATGRLAWTIPLIGTISDPDVPASQAGSGVITNSVMLALVDKTGAILGGISQPVTVTGTTWEIDYATTGQRPAGTYTVTITAEDGVGNKGSTEAGTIQIDERPPSVDMTPGILTGYAISNSRPISGTISDLPDWGSAVAQYHFEEPAGSTQFNDSSPQENHAQCTTCPAFKDGPFGQAVEFNGLSGHQLTISDTESLDLADDLTIALWYRPSTSVLVQAADFVSKEDNYTFGVNSTIHKTLTFAYNNGGSIEIADNSGASLAGNEWNHLAVVVSGQNDEIRFYKDGILLSTHANDFGAKPLITNTNPITIGERLDDRLDEMMIFDRALTAEEIYALSISGVSGVNSVDVALSPFDFVNQASRTPQPADWKSAVLESPNTPSSQWDYQIPGSMEGFYELVVRGDDAVGNQSRNNIMWRGTIDNVAPTVSGNGTLIGGTNAQQTEYTFTFADFVLDADSYEQACDAGELISLTYDDAAIPQNGLPYQVNATCRVAGHEASRDFTACDWVGHCTTLTITPVVAALGNITIDSPAEGQIFIENETITILGEAYDPTSITSITLYADGVEIDTPVFIGNDSVWSATWSTGLIADHLLEAVMIGEDGTLTKSVNITVIQDPLDDLFVDVVGTGGGIVTSDPAGIACGSDCDERVLFNSAITLTANAHSGSTFTGWTGGCVGASSCTATISDTTFITATFTLNRYDLTVSATNDGNGTVSSEPSGLIDCGTGSSDCSETLDYGTMVTLTANIGLESIFNGWSSNCASISNTCVVTITETENVTADFSLNRYDLTTAISGDGSGTLTSDPIGINCVSLSGSDCDESLAYGTPVTLTAAADGASVFTGWLGDCSGLDDCLTTISANKHVTATFAHSTYDLTVGVDGTSLGAINSEPAGISACTSSAGDCLETISYNMLVTLTASYDASQMSLAWGGSCSTTTGDVCLVTMNEIHNVTATFTLGEFSLGTTLVGNGNGSVDSDSSGINCEVSAANGATTGILSGMCNNSFTASSMITLTATAGHESIFEGWSGPCSGTDSCVVSLTQAEQVTATFTLNQYDFVIHKTGDGAGTITSGPIGLDCSGSAGGNCGITFDYVQTPITVSVDYGSLITLAATAGYESQFDGWSDDCSAVNDSGEICSMTINQSETLTATFSLNDYVLDVNTAGNGAGVIISDPAGIACASVSGVDCSEQYRFGTSVTLTPAANSDSIFAGWSGGCTGTGPCTVTLNMSQAVTAIFDQAPVVYTLDVILTGDGSGTVSSSPSGVNCEALCEAEFAENTLVTLTVAPAAGSQFKSWGGACAGEPTAVCMVTLNQAKIVVANFTADIVVDPPVQHLIFLPFVVR